MGGTGANQHKQKGQIDLSATNTAAKLAAEHLVSENTVKPAGKTLDQNDPVFSTAEQVAAETGVSSRTVKRNGKMAEEVESDPELLAALNDRTFCRNLRKVSHWTPAKKSPRPPTSTGTTTAL